ncbi:carboxymuconolactone decarboxylase family protein [Moraxella catarrhalis]|uniref:carboxymuconolactone decarboxylase family protein n=2 Tax=Moraxella catarrhalis TaxID=480 RepID=UPI000202AB39|nr:carboxymuconolactone decarboxylase family protein [Moraxella catarrhalis]EGE15717.1 carboxymuconolactone decarboxylase [Moraxella catarrhalis BC1]
MSNQTPLLNLTPKQAVPIAAVVVFVLALTMIYIQYPDLVEMLINSIYGNIYQRGVLTTKERHIATLSALIAMGGSKRQLSFQGLAAYKLGITKEEIQEILIQNAIFSGFARAMNAAVLLDEAYKKYVQGKDSEA